MGIMAENHPGNNDFFDELLDYIDSQEVVELGVTTENSFTITNAEQANYIVKQYNKLVSEVNDIEAAAQKAIESHNEKVNTWKESQLKARRGTMDWLATRLRIYAENQLSGSKKKSLALPEGKLQFKKHEEIDYGDQEELVAFLKDNGLMMFLKNKAPIVDKVKLKSAGTFDGDGKLVINGKVVAGVTKTIYEDKFMVS